MKDTIYRQAAIDAAKEELENGTFYDIPSKIEYLPSAQPDTVRCKDCKWSDWYTAVDGKRYCYCMETGNGGRTENDFCSYAERGTDGADN